MKQTPISKQLANFSIAATALFALFIVGMTVYAASLTATSDLTSENFKSGLNTSATAGTTELDVMNSSGFTIGDIIYIDNGTLTETGAVTAVTSTGIVVATPIVNTYSSTGTVISKISGIKHTISFTTLGAATLGSIRFTLSDAALTDGGDLSSVTFSDLSGGLTGPAAPASVSSGTVVFDIVPDTFFGTGAVLGIALNDVVNPNGSSSKSYGLKVTALDPFLNEFSAEAFFTAGSEMIVARTIAPSFTVVIADDGVANNPADSTGSGDIMLGELGLDTVDATGTGYGVDGNLITVTTNAPGGYTLSVRSSTGGLAAPTYTGTGRSISTTDDAINDITGGPTTWPAAGTEAYGFSTGTGFDSTGVATDYDAFPLVDTVVKTTAAPVDGEETFITVRAQATPTTFGEFGYFDAIIYTFLPSF